MVMLKVNVFEIKAKLSEYLDRAARGERVVICRHNKPIAEIRPISEAASKPRPIGPIPGRPTFDVPAEFFEPLPADELALWEGTVATDPLSAGRIRPSSSRPARVAETRKDSSHKRRARTSRQRS
jgi:prevent-host-death family protein